MALTFKVVADARSMLGPSAIFQPAILTPAASDYPTGGYAMYTSSGSAPDNAGQQFGFGSLTGIVFLGFTGTALNYIWLYNRTTCKIQVYSAPGTEIAANTDLSGGTVKVNATGF